MPYYATYDEDVKRAKAIVERGLPGGDLYAAEQLLVSFIEAIEAVGPKVCDLAVRQVRRETSGDQSPS